RSRILEESSGGNREGCISSRRRTTTLRCGIVVARAFSLLLPLHAGDDDSANSLAMKESKISQRTRIVNDRDAREQFSFSLVRGENVSQGDELVAVDGHEGGGDV